MGGLLEEVECREHAEEVSSSVERSRLPVPLLPAPTLGTYLPNLFLLLNPLLDPGVEYQRSIPVSGRSAR